MGQALFLFPDHVNFTPGQAGHSSRNDIGDFSCRNDWPWKKSFPVI